MIHERHCPFGPGEYMGTPCFGCVAIRAAKEEEREACAMVAKEVMDEVDSRNNPYAVAKIIYHGIRARGVAAGVAVTQRGGARDGKESQGEKTSPEPLKPGLARDIKSE